MYQEEGWNWKYKETINESGRKYPQKTKNGGNLFLTSDELMVTMVPNLELNKKFKRKENR